MEIIGEIVLIKCIEYWNIYIENCIYCNYNLFVNFFEILKWVLLYDIIV